MPERAWGFNSPLAHVITRTPAPAGVLVHFRDAQPPVTGSVLEVEPRTMDGDLGSSTDSLVGRIEAAQTHLER